MEGETGEGGEERGGSDSSSFSTALFFSLLYSTPFFLIFFFSILTDDLSFFGDLETLSISRKKSSSACFLSAKIDGSGPISVITDSDCSFILFMFSSISSSFWTEPMFVQTFAFEFPSKRISTFSFLTSTSFSFSLFTLLSD